MSRRVAPKPSISNERISYTLPLQRGFDGKEDDGARGDTVGHRLAVTRVLSREVLPGEGGDAPRVCMLTASRDASIGVWSMEQRCSCGKLAGDADEGSHVQWVGALEHHSHWVNDIARCGARCLLSASSDCTIKRWDLSQQLSGCGTSSPETLRYHSDYVQAVAVPQSRVCSCSAVTHRAFASAGLDGVVCMWDVEHSFVGAEHVKPLRHFTMPELGRGRSLITWGLISASASPSVYSVAMDEGGEQVFSGCCDGVVRIFDVRSIDRGADGGERAPISLVGHTDSVRALYPGFTSKHSVVSVASDGLFIEWDVRMSRPLKTTRVSDGGLWCLAASSTNNCYYVSGKEGKVWQVGALAESEGAASGEGAPRDRVKVVESVSKCSVLSLCNEQCGGEHGYDRVWAGTTAPQLFSLVTSGNEATRSRGGAVDLPFRAAIVRTHVFDNRRHLLTQDSLGKVCLWNVLNATLIKDLGEVGWEDALKQQHIREDMPAWFTCDTRIGQVMVHLDFPDCFAGLVTAGDLNISELPPSHKVNMGQRVLHYLFEHWVQSYKEKVAEAREKEAEARDKESAAQEEEAEANTKDQDDIEDGADERERGERRASIPSDQKSSSDDASETASGGKPKATPTQSSMGQSAVKGAARSNSGESSSAAKQSRASKMKARGLKWPSKTELARFRPFFQLPGNTFVAVSDRSRGVTRSTSRVCSLTTQNYVPKWAQECLLDAYFPSREEDQLPIILIPHPASSMPALPYDKSTKVWANRIMKAQDILAHVVKALGMLWKDQPSPSGGSEERGTDDSGGEEQTETNGAEETEQTGSKPPLASVMHLSCCDEDLDPLMSISTVKKYIWKKSAAIELLYRLKDEYSRDMFSFKPSSKGRR